MRPQSPQTSRESPSISPSLHYNDPTTNSSDGNSKNIGEIMSLLCGMAPTPDNCEQVLRRTYCYGDSLQPTTAAAAANNDHLTDTLTYYLGLPPTDEMNEVTKAMLKHQAGKLERRSNDASVPSLELPAAAVGSGRPRRSLTGGDPQVPFSSTEYDVISYIARQCFQAAQRCGASLHRATHHRSPTSQKNPQAAAGDMTTTPHRTLNGPPCSLSIPEELLGS